MATALKKDARLEFKTTEKTKQLLNQAASLAGQDLTSFVMSCAEERAKGVLSEYRMLELQREEQENFFKALSQPSRPTDALKDLMSGERLVERD